MIESSLAKQYGLRIRQYTDMPWPEFITLVSGLMPDTPLGSIVTIRSETDSETIKKFTSEQRRIHSGWRKRSADRLSVDPNHSAKLEKLMKRMFGGGETI